MEKKDLEINIRGMAIGAFEDVSNVVEGEGIISFDSKDGKLKFVQDERSIYRMAPESEPADLRLSTIVFDAYKVQVRRTTKKHFGKGYVDPRHVEA